MTDRLYNIPANMKPREEWREVILRSSSPGDLVQAFNRFRDRSVCVRGLELTPPPLPAASRFDLDSDLAELEALPENTPIEIQVWPEELSRLYVWRVMLRRFKIVVTLEAGRGFSKSVKEATRMGYPVKIGPSSFIRKHQKELLAIAHYYFHDRALKVPIEPVHSLFKTWVSGKGADLLEVYREVSKRYIYITEAGKQTLSNRWERDDLLQGTVSNSGKGDVFKQMEGCSVCAAFRICGGAPKCDVPLGDCETVLALAGLFRREATTMAEVAGALLF